MTFSERLKLIAFFHTMSPYGSYLRRFDHLLHRFQIPEIYAEMAGKKYGREKVRLRRFCRGKQRLGDNYETA